MINRDNVISGLHCRAQDLIIDLPDCDKCDYQVQLVNRAECDFRRLCKDALELLKEQEAEWIYGEDETGVDGWRCSECDFFEPWFYDFDDDIDFIKRYEHCPKCGRRMTSYTGKQEGR